MRWTERQQAMLQAMGLRLWAPEGGADAAAVTLTSDVVAPAAAPSSPAPVLPARSAQPLPVPMPMPMPVPPHAEAPALSRARAAVATLDWPALRAAVADCRACTLCETRTQTVFGVGHPRARWMVVGEAPGEQEDLKGEPFVGAAGRLLDRMLAALGLTRQVGDDPDAVDAARQVYIANTLKCRPPRNRNPEPEELLRCQPFLERQVELVQPRVILAMGRFAVQSLLDSSEPIGRLRGRVHAWRGRPLVVTYHPAYLLRSPADKARAWADLCLAARAAETNPAG